MKNVILAFLVALLFSAPHVATAADPVLTVQNEPVSVVKKEKHTSFKSFRKATEKRIGRKLGLFERLGLWYYTKLTPEPEFDKKKANNQALTGFILGLCGLIILPLLSIPGFFFSNAALTKEKLAPGTLDASNKTLAKVGLILSIVGFFSLLLVILYILLISAAWGFGI
jgi:hypothetical protein